MIAGKRRDIGLGRYPDVGLAQAREAAAKHRSLIAAVQRSQASLAAKRCLEFLILTAARSGEARGARWSEIDLDAATWVTPAERMKANAEHRVPLSSRALATLEEARTIGDGSGLVFPSPTRPGKPMSDMTLTALLRRLKVADRATVHGFRSAFRDWPPNARMPRTRSWS